MSTRRRALWPNEARFKRDQIVRHAQLPRLLGRILGISHDGVGTYRKVYYRIEWVDEGEHKLCPVVEQAWVKRIDPLTALASMA